MKVIQYGEGYPIHVHCSMCRSILEIEPGDIIQFSETIGIEMTGTKQKTTQYVVCPVCGDVVVVREKVENHGCGIQLTMF